MAEKAAVMHWPGMAKKVYLERQKVYLKVYLLKPGFSVADQAFNGKKYTKGIPRFRVCH